MGTLAHFDLSALITRYHTVHFVETGTGRGDGIAHATRYPFHTLRSCESVPELAAAATDLFTSDRRVAIYPQSSATFLSSTCAIVPANEPILFWLDAHFPGADYGMASYGAESDGTLRLPLPAELRVIADSRPAHADVILCDDLRIWVDGPFASRNLPADVRPYCPKVRSAAFFAEIFGETHDVHFNYVDEGYVALVPRQVP